ncbi:MAG: class I tRNA ligase family protein [Candidatus Paceibacterota bacterium]
MTNDRDNEKNKTEDHSARVEIKAESDISRREEEVLAFWNERHIFQKSLEKPSPEGDFVFYDGPPFATGLPHYGHILPGTIKDTIPRFQTMRGKHVRRQWGWDVHGLPVENLIEKKLGVNTKKEIEEFGIARFNEEARSSVLEYRDDWKEIIPRTGRWVDMDNDYKTMDTTYSESAWWIFKSLFDKGLVYQGFKSMHLCPRCETTLSNFEVNLGYADIKDLSVTVKLELVDEKNTFLLIWTTTPWTLPGNVAAAVHSEVEYSKVSFENEFFWVAREAITRVFGDKEISVVETKKGSELVGLSYTPPFPYFLEKPLEHKENAWKVYSADYVTTEDGTGIVHLAPAFGEEDLLLAEEHAIPIVHHVTKDGSFTEEVTDFAGKKVKPKDTEGEDHMESDIEIIKWLAHHDLLFAKEKITHSYPHCYRCDTPLLNYASESWFISVTDIKDNLLKANKSVHWTPSEIGEGRFGKWLENARDWAISRERYWGAPLPVWKSKDETEIEVFGSIRDLRLQSKEALTELIVVRHGESEKNKGDYIDSSLDTFDLTPEGVRQAEETAERLAGVVDVVYSSPVLRSRRTAEIIAKTLGLEVIISGEIGEIQSGEWDGRQITDPDIQKSRKAFASLDSEVRYSTKHGATGESWEEFDTRLNSFIDEVVASHKGKCVLVVGHQGTVQFTNRRATSEPVSTKLLNSLSAGPYAEPHCYTFRTDTLKPFDFHRPYIDEIVVYSKKGTELVRIPEVFDTWYESGSMPYGQYHYPFENIAEFDPLKNIGFPADFISEGLDQTRGWFYSLMVLGVGLFGVSPYKNVIVHGMILAEDGKKMSKRLKNYPDVMRIINKYGADALRYYLLSSPVIRGEELWFSEKGVAEVMRKLIARLDNVVSFYELYRQPAYEKSARTAEESTHPLDVWILARLQVLENSVRQSVENYELDRSTRPILDFIDDLSTWYLRRSRDRFKGEDEKDRKHTGTTLYVVLKTLSKIMAPFTPFYAEYLFRLLRQEEEEESVHLAEWPVLARNEKKRDETLNAMSRVRDIVSEGLQERSSAGIKVRQPLATLYYGGEQLPRELEGVIADELNVKKCLYKKGQESVALDLEITKALQDEGTLRELMRVIQSRRKELGLNPHDEVALSIETNEEGKRILSLHKAVLVSTVSARALTVEVLTEPGESALVIEGIPFGIALS